MKNFNTINQLWDNLLICPFCNKERKVELSIGPDGVFNLITWDKSKNIITIVFSISIESVLYTSTWKIDCNSNKFGINTKSMGSELTSSLPSSEYSNLYFYLYSECNNCNNSFSNTSDLSISSKEYLKIDNIGIEREGWFIKKPEHQQYYALVADYQYDKMYFNNVEMFKGIIKKKSKEISLPLLELDFSNHEKLLNKIGTMLLFK
jgi:hypothetical protein